MTDPIDRIKWVPSTSIRPNPWNPNRVHTPELRLLERSLLATGWIQPLLVSPDDTWDGEYMLIDGFHRWRLSQDSKAIQGRDGGLVPVAVLDLTREDAMLMTVRINRAKGSHASVLMSDLVRDLLDRGVTRERIMAEMGATATEVDLLASEGLFKSRNIAGHAYSPSWYPVEGKKGVDDKRILPTRKRA